jgi:hypothetical protein
MKPLSYLIFFPILILFFVTARWFGFVKRRTEDRRYDVDDLLTEESEA